MRVVQAVFGVFHHFELAHQLHRRHHLQRIYSTWPWARLQREGLPRDLVRAFPLLHTSEYLLNRTGHAPLALTAKLASWNALAFDRYTNHQIVRDPRGMPDAFIAISGAGLLTGRKVQQGGGVFICDRGSTHQRFQEQVVSAEYQRAHRLWGVPVPPAKPHLVVREEAIYAQADAITVPSTVAKRSFIAMGVPAGKVHVIPYGVRLDKFLAPASNEGPPTGSFDLLFAGGVSLRKGVPDLLQAFADLHHPNKHLTVVGSISAEARTFLRQLPTDRVIFTGPMPQPMLARVMARSHALVLPSVEEGLALVLAQAMACGCPVIATVATGAEDLLTPAASERGTDGSSAYNEGIIVPTGDVAALTAAMQNLADDSALRAAMSSAAIDRVESLGGWDHYGDIWESLLHSLTRL